MEKNSKIYIAGHKGMVGSAIYRKLESDSFTNLIYKSSKELDLTDQTQVEQFFKTEKPEYVIIAAAKVGGILANNIYRAEFIYENLMIQNNLIHASHIHNVKKLLLIGSSCIYPKLAPQPLKEEHLLTGELEPTNEPYAIAKIAGIEMYENYYKEYNSNFISVMPTNLYGPNDNFNLETSHVLAALIRKFILARYLETNNWHKIKQDFNEFPINGISGESSKNKILEELKNQKITVNSNSIQIKLWGSGEVFRQFLHVDDMANACIHIIQNVSAIQLYDSFHLTHINIGTDSGITIKELANIIKEIVGSNSDILWDNAKPDGTPKKQLDISLLKKLGFSHTIDLREGIQSIVKHYQS